MKLLWRRGAVRDLEQIQDFLAEKNHKAASLFTDSVNDALQLVRKFPLSGRTGTRVAGTRELVLHPYLIVYRCDKQLFMGWLLSTEAERSKQVAERRNSAC